MSDSEYLFGTVVRITINETRADSIDLIADSFGMSQVIENITSATQSDSELSNVNRKAFYEDVSLSKTLYDIISSSLYYCELSEGAFDIGLGGLIDLWGIGTDNARVPELSEIEKFIYFHGYEHIILDNDKKTIRFDDERVKIDLGACVKGYAEDKVSEYLRSCGVRDFILDFGGSVSENVGGYAFAVRSPEGGTACSSSALYSSVVTSGDYERFFEANGRRYHHILDSSTGFPADNGLRSVTVNIDSAFVGDCLSTAVFVLGRENGAALLDKLQCEYIMISDDIFSSDGLSLDITNK